MADRHANRSDMVGCDRLADSAKIGGPAPGTNCLPKVACMSKWRRGRVFHFSRAARNSAAYEGSSGWSTSCRGQVAGFLPRQPDGMTVRVIARENRNLLASNGNALVACDSEFHPIAANFKDDHLDSFTNHDLLICPSTEYQHLFTSGERKPWVRPRSSTRTPTPSPHAWTVSYRPGCAG
jgi:hypothetical protein